MKLQQEYGYSPTAGCLPMLVNMLILFGMIEVVYRPVQYLLGIPKDVITTACEALSISTANTTMMQTQLIEKIHAGAAAGIATGLSAEQFDLIANFNTTFLGMDMCTIPGFRFDPIIIFPIIAVTMIVSYWLSTKLAGQQAQMQGSMKIMMWAMNIMFVVMCFQLPVCFSVYYGTSNICMILQTILTNTVYSPEKFKAQYEAELAAKKAAKKEKKVIEIEENGKTVKKEVNKKELDKMRLEYARQRDAERQDAFDRTVPLTDAERAEREAAQNSKKKKKK